MVLKPKENLYCRKGTDEQKILSDALSFPLRGFGLTISHHHSLPVEFKGTFASQEVKCFRKTLLIPCRWEYESNFRLACLEMSTRVYNNFTATLFVH